MLIQESPLRGPVVLTLILLTVLMLAVSSGSGAVGAESAPAVRLLPYPFADVVSFASDVDGQRPWHGAAIHRVFNEEIGLPISDSLWPQGDSVNASSLFFGPGRLNRASSGVGTEPTFALLLRQWHRGNIDHFHSWQEDGPFELRNEIKPPLELSGVRTEQRLPDVHPDLAPQMSQNVRFYFSAEPPPDLQIVVHDEQGKSMSFDAASIEFFPSHVAIGLDMCGANAVHPPRIKQLRMATARFIQLSYRAFHISCAR